MNEITQIKKRSGEVVDFNPAKIKVAITKAFGATYGGIKDEIIDTITSNVLSDIGTFFSQTIPTVEGVQDVVEKEIMEAGFFDVAKAYIVYRYEHTKEREHEKREKLIETQKKIETNALKVIKRDGKSEVFSIEKVESTLEKAARGLDGVDIVALAHQVEREIYDGISTIDISKALIMAARAWIERDPVYSDLAARLLHMKLYKEMGIENYLKIQNSKVKTAEGSTMSGSPTKSGMTSPFEQKYRSIFIQNIKKAVKIGKLDKKMLKFDLERLASALAPERDNLLKYMGAQTLYDRYFLRNPETKEILETPQMLWMRVAMGLAVLEEDKEKWAEKFYEVISTLRYMPSTPTLFHAGTSHPQLSSCYLNTVNDDLGHIFKVIGDNAQLSKWSGGIGTDWTYLRGTGALIKGTGVESQGVIPFLKVSNDATHAINRSGRRRGAACVYLETWHYDIESFLELRKNTGDERRRTHDIDTANWIPDLFMKRVRDDAEWTLFSPDETPDLHDLYGKKFEERYQEYERMAAEGKIRLFKTIKAKDLWKKMLAMLFETGHPWLTWKDPSNVRSPQDHVGVVHNSNLCTEITLNTSDKETAVCNLGSVNLALHLKLKMDPTSPGGYEGHGNRQTDDRQQTPMSVIASGETRERGNLSGKIAEPVLDHDRGSLTPRNDTTEYELDEDLIKDTVTIAIRMLDNTVDVNFYPTIEAKRANEKHRPVGLGVMGFQDMLFMMNVPFDSEEMVLISDESQEMIAYYAYLASSELAKERGAYESFQGSKWNRGILPHDTIDLLELERGEKIRADRTVRLDWQKVRASIKKYGMRNSNCLAIAPTSNLGNITGVNATIEPIYKNIFVKANAVGDFIIINPYLVAELKEIGMWDERMLGKIKYYDGSIAKIPEIPAAIRAKHKETFEIDPIWLVKAAAARGRWIDQSQSLNIYFQGTSGAKLSEIYFYAWEMGLKTTYYLRTLAKSQVEKSTVDTAAFGKTHKREIDEFKNQTSKIKMIDQNVKMATPKLAATSSVIASEASEAILERDRHVAIDTPRDDNQENPTTPALSPEASTTLQLCRLDDPTCESCQ